MNDRLRQALHAIQSRLAGVSAPALGWGWLAVVAGAVLALYYPAGMVLVHHIDDDPAFVPASQGASGSRAAAM
ncbi:MAG: hypothetical protein EPN20_03295, partial [Magnetospirillum sp.]